MHTLKRFSAVAKILHHDLKCPDAMSCTSHCDDLAAAISSFEYETDADIIISRKIPLLHHPPFPIWNQPEGTDNEKSQS